MLPYRKTCLSVFAVGCLMMAGCDLEKQQAMNTVNRTALVASQNAAQVSKQIIQSTVNTPKTNQDNTNNLSKAAADQVSQGLEVSYARLAVNRNDICPKLVEFKFVSQSVTRSNERLVQNTCEYYVFLNTGERLRVAVSPEMKAEISNPLWYDLANGEFKAPHFDRYTVKLRYNGTRYHPQNFTYDVIVSKNPTNNGI